MAASGIAQLREDVRAGGRRALARAITLVESSRASDRAAADALLTPLLPHTGKALRIGISGAPGAGKSTFIEALGARIAGQAHRLAVLAVDPSSQRSGGSVLGDKTRMEMLARNPAAFIRPSPAGKTLGGVARRTREAMLLVEAAGFDAVLVETVGVGQSETAVAGMVDVFVLLVSPSGGDELQGIKRGVMELADIVLVTKADGDLIHAASRAAADYRQALHLMRPKYPGMAAQVMEISALEGRGIEGAWEAVCGFHEQLRISGALAGLRRRQLRNWFWNEMEAILFEEISGRSAAGQAEQMASAVAAGKLLPGTAARLFLKDISRARPRN